MFPTKKEIWDKELSWIDRNKDDIYIGVRKSRTQKEFDKRRKKVLKRKLP